MTRRIWYALNLKAYLKFEVFQRTIPRFFSEPFTRPNCAPHGTKKNKKRVLKWTIFSKSEGSFFTFFVKKWPPLLVNFHPLLELVYSWLLIFKGSRMGHLLRLLFVTCVTLLINIRFRPFFFFFFFFLSFQMTTTTFSLKQGETRTSSGPIPHPLSA